MDVITRNKINTILMEQMRENNELIETRNKILEIIEKNDQKELEKYVKDHNLLLNALNNKSFDILIYAIESKASNDMIQWMIHQSKYSTFNYQIFMNNDFKTPLFSALAKNNFKVADCLIKRKADVNFLDHDLIHHLNQLKLLDKKNLKFILNHGYHVKGITSQDILHFIDTYQIDLLDIIFKHYIFDNDFILYLLKIYHQKTPLSDTQLEHALMRERHKIMITEEMYERVDSSSNFEAIKPLFENDDKDRDNILCKINRYDILEKAILIDDYSFVKEVLHYKKLNCKSYTYESNFMEANNLSNMDILKLLIDSSVKAMPMIEVEVEIDVIDGEKKDSNSDSNYSKKVHDPRYFNLLLNILIRMENILLINYLLKNNPSDVNLNSKDINGEYPIFNAYHRNRKDIFNYLLDYDFDCNIKNNNVSLLSLAISNNDYDLIKYLLKHNANIKETDINGNYPLIKAIYQNAIDIVILLVEYANDHDIDMNVTDINGNTPLTLSYRLNYKTIFKYLVCYLDINMRDSNGNNILYYAIEDEDLETIRYLIHNKIDIHSINNLNISPFDCAIIKGKKILTLLLENTNNTDIAFNVPNSKNETPLITIIKSKNYSLKEKENIISLLIAKGANVNFIDEKEMTPLIYAIQEKSLSMVQMLVKNGANVNHCNPSDSCRTILKYAIDSNQYEIVKYLVQCNANINFDNPYSLSLFGNTFKEIDRIDVHILEYIIVKMDVKYITGIMLYKIIRQGNLKILKSLVERKLDVNTKDSEGDSLLAIAIFYKDESIVRYLLECEGVDFNSKNKRGKSIADYNEEYFGKNNSYEDIYNRVQQYINDSSNDTTAPSTSDNISPTATIF